MGRKRTTAKQIINMGRMRVDQAKRLKELEKENSQLKW